jgi:hypothetical protein
LTSVDDQPLACSMRIALPSSSRARWWVGDDLAEVVAAKQDLAHAGDGPGAAGTGDALVVELAPDAG